MKEITSESFREFEKACNDEMRDGQYDLYDHEMNVDFDLMEVKCSDDSTLTFKAEISSRLSSEELGKLSDENRSLSYWAFITFSIQLEKFIKRSMKIADLTVYYDEHDRVNFTRHHVDINESMKKYIDRQANEFVEQRTKYILQEFERTKNSKEIIDWYRSGKKLSQYAKEHRGHFAGKKFGF